MTRGEIKRRIRILGRHYFGGENDQDPFGLDLLITEVANDLARRTDCYIGRRYLDLVAGTTEYCDSDLYRLKNILILQDDGTYNRARLIDWADAKNPEFRHFDTENVPTHVMVFGANRIKVYPVPASSVTNGLMIEGYAIPGDYWLYDTNGNAVTTNLDIQECPLPAVAHDAIVYGVLKQRAVQSRDMDMAQYYDQEYQTRVGMVESYAATYARRTL
jgi:hypothetical protein